MQNLDAFTLERSPYCLVTYMNYCIFDYYTAYWECWEQEIDRMDSFARGYPSVGYSRSGISFNWVSVLDCGDKYGLSVADKSGCCDILYGSVLSGSDTLGAAKNR